LDLTQTQKAEWGDYRIPSLEILIDGQPAKVDLNGRQTHQVIDGVPKKPKKVEVDPNGWWLLKATVRGER
jgi:hypothetical protein